MRKFVLWATLVVGCGLTAGFQNCSNVGFSKSAGIVDQASASDTGLGAGAVAPVCRAVTAPEVQPKLKWDWFANLPASPAPRFEAFNQVMAAPMVGDLNGDGHPEVVFTTFSNDPNDKFADIYRFPGGAFTMYAANGVLRIVDGASGLTNFSVGSADLAPFSASSPLLMDIDGDGKMEIFYYHYTSKFIVALNASGSPRWRYQFAQAGGYTFAGPTAGAPRPNGVGTLVAGAYVLSEDGAHQPILVGTLGTPSADDFAYTTLSLPLDPARPSQWHVVNRRGVFDSDGRQLETFPSANAYLAAADLYPDVPGVEIVSTGGGDVRVYNGLTGGLIRSVNLGAYVSLTCPGGTIGGGPATIGDFDGSGQVEVAIATGRNLLILDRDLKPLYATVTQDCSSLSTGITSFDLNGDGKPEIFYGDETYFRVYHVDGGQLRVAWQMTNPSGTLIEYPVVADLGNDGSSNLLVIGNNYAVNGLYPAGSPAADGAAARSITGVRAFQSSAPQAWMPSRPIWNQYGFHPDLVDNHGRMNSAPVWQTKSFRRNNQGTRVDMTCTPPGI